MRIDGRLHKISQELEWLYDRNNWMAPWRIRGDRIDLTLTPSFYHHHEFDRWIISARGSGVRPLQWRGDFRFRRARACRRRVWHGGRGATQMVGGVNKTEPELIDEVDLCLPNGRLNPAAVGRTRKPLHNTNLRGWGRNKRFEYWCIATLEIAVALNVSHSDYRVTLATFFLNLQTVDAFSQAEIHWLPRERVDDMPIRSGAGPVIGRGDRMRIEMLPTGTGMILRGHRSLAHRARNH